MFNKKLKDIFTAAPADTGKIIKGCFHCPLNKSCAILLWDTHTSAHNRCNYGNCDCTDERLIALKNAFNVDQKLLKDFYIKERGYLNDL